MPGAFAYLLNAFLLTTVLIMGLKQVALPLGLVDRPDSRRTHEGLVPLCGGVALFTAYLVAALSMPQRPETIYGFLIAILILLAIGVVDDRWRLPPWPRLAAETAAAILLVSTIEIRGFSFGFPLPGIAPDLLPLIALATAIVFAVGMMNAVNMMDGIDGLAGIAAAVALFFLALAAAHIGQSELALQALLLLSATIAFLVFNLRHPWRPRAAIFLGEAGSATLGAALAFLTIALASGPHALPFASLLWVTVVPVIDTLSLSVRRIAAGRSPFSADRQHLHHLLLDMGFSPSRTTALIGLASAVLGAIGLAAIALKVPGIVMLVGLAAPVAAHTSLVLACQRRQRTFATPPQAETESRPAQMGSAVAPQTEGSA